MLAQALQIKCSKRCELVLALSYLMAPDSLLPIAHRLANDKERSAVRLAEKLASMSRQAAQQLAAKTLAADDVYFELRGDNLWKQAKR